MLPTVAPLGSILMEYVPVAGNVCVGSVKLAAFDVDEVSDVPSGLSSVTVTIFKPLFVNAIDTCWPDVPLKVGVAFWPGTVVVKVSDEPPIVTVPVASAGTSFSVKFTLPIAASQGLTRIVYVPALASTSVSMNPAPEKVFDASVVPSGALSVTVAQFCAPAAQ